MIQTPYPVTVNYINCPACGEERFAVSHLPMGCRTVWACGKCGVHFSVNVVAEGIETEVTRVRTKKTVVTLRCEVPITITVEGQRVIDPSDTQTEEQRLESERYFYEEHTCPENYLRAINEVYDAARNEDPHGIFKFVKTEDAE